MQLKIRRFECVRSTMDLASAAVAVGEPEGLVFIAHEQTEGRGRLGRDWVSPSGAGVYLSLVLRPPAERDRSRLVALITLAAGVGVRDGIVAATGFEPHLKWPNDIVCGRRKLAGILAEGIAIGSEKQAVVVGIGVNVRHASFPPDIADRATSLETELGRPVDSRVVERAILDATARRYESLCRGDADDILRDWRAAAPCAQGARVEWETTQGVRQGVTAGIDDAGGLLIKTRAGVERVYSGELRWQ